MLRSHFTWTGVCLLALFAAFNCNAQESRGSITGKVTDPQNAVVPGASIVVTNTATNVARRTTTNETGYYEVTFLDPGAYSVEIDTQGFKKAVRSAVTLEIGDRLACAASRCMSAWA
jgi:hypothetical protein